MFDKQIRIKKEEIISIDNKEMEPFSTSATSNNFKIIFWGFNGHTYIEKEVICEEDLITFSLFDDVIPESGIFKILSIKSKFQKFFRLLVENLDKKIIKKDIDLKKKNEELYITQKVYFRHKNYQENLYKEVNYYNKINGKFYGKQTRLFINLLVLKSDINLNTELILYCPKTGPEYIHENVISWIDHTDKGRVKAIRSRKFNGRCPNGCIIECSNDLPNSQSFYFNITNVKADRVIIPRNFIMSSYTYDKILINVKSLVRRYYINKDILIAEIHETILKDDQIFFRQLNTGTLGFFQIVKDDYEAIRVDGMIVKNIIKQDIMVDTLAKNLIIKVLFLDTK
nr:uncharacterized protein LOC128705221 isoform X2 [Cherax quadricarinatus]